MFSRFRALTVDQQALPRDILQPCSYSLASETTGGFLNHLSFDCFPTLCDFSFGKTDIMTDQSDSVISRGSTLLVPERTPSLPRYDDLQRHEINEGANKCTRPIATGPSSLKSPGISVLPGNGLCTVADPPADRNGLPSDDSQEPGPQNLKRNRKVGDWFWETLGLLVSLVGVAATIVLVWAFTGGSVDLWPSQKITLNAVLSILSIFIRMPLLFVATQCLSQAKWLLYSRTKGRKGSPNPPHSLVDLQTFDDASRGPRRSLQLLFKNPTAMFGIWGSIIIILAVAMDPFFQ
jgi:hypothetical protein